MSEKGTPVKYRSKPSEIEAVRYGKDDDGRFYEGAVGRVAAFIAGLGPDAEMTGAQVVDYVQPDGAWDPPDPKHSTIRIKAWKGGESGWVTVALGDWIARYADDPTDHWPINAGAFANKYEPLHGPRPACPECGWGGDVGADTPNTIPF